MTQPKHPKQPRKGPSRSRALITTASVLATVAGWGMIASSQEAPVSSTPAALQTSADATVQDPGPDLAYLQSLPPIASVPTLAPLPSMVVRPAPILPTPEPASKGTGTGTGTARGASPSPVAPP